MKALIAAASVAALVSVAPAMAQAQTANTGVYANLGYAHTDGEGVNLGALGGRLGYRFNDWIGVEGEAAIGVKDDDYNVGTTNVDVELKHQFAGYVVGFAPIAANTDLLARLGYGKTKIKESGGGLSVSGEGESWNYGVGVQHHFDGMNGVRLDWTRHDFDDGGGKANVWSIAYTRRF